MNARLTWSGECLKTVTAFHRQPCRIELSSSGRNLTRRFPPKRIACVRYTAWQWIRQHLSVISARKNFQQPAKGAYIAMDVAGSAGLRQVAFSRKSAEPDHGLWPSGSWIMVCQ